MVAIESRKHPRGGPSLRCPAPHLVPADQFKPVDTIFLSRICKRGSSKRLWTLLANERL